MSTLYSYLPATRESLRLALEQDEDSESITIFYRMLEDPSFSSESIFIKEVVILSLLLLLREENRAEEIGNLLTRLRPYFRSIPKSRTTKVVRKILDVVASIPGTSHLHISLCKEVVQWTRAENRSLLRRQIEYRLASLLMKNKDYSDSLNVLTGLMEEAKRLDDHKPFVVIKLVESKVHWCLRNLPKAKVALTAARTVANNVIYVPPVLQGAIDLQSGILRLEEKHYDVACRYFFEAFKAFGTYGDPDPLAVFSVKYIMLCLIIVHRSGDAARIRTSRMGPQKCGGIELDAMEAVANAYSMRSLKLFKAAVRDFRVQLEGDPIVERHLSFLYESLFELNMCLLIKPFSRVEIGHIAEMIELPIDVVEKKLSQMILDKKFAGSLDEGDGCLIILGDPKTDRIYEAALETISNICKVVDTLLVRAAKIITF